MTPPELVYRLQFIREQLNYWELQLTLISGTLTKEEALRRLALAAKSLRAAERYMAPVATIENHAEAMRASLRVIRDKAASNKPQT